MKQKQNRSVRWGALVPLFVTLVSCANATSTTQCSTVSSTASQGSSGVAAQYNATRAIGGYLVGYHLPTPTAKGVRPESYEKSFCAATILGDQLDYNQLGFWTATHCLDYSRLVKVEFVRYRRNAQGAGTYSLETSLNKIVEGISLARGFLQNFPPDLVDNLMRSVFRVPEASGTSWCQSYTKENRVQGAQQVCSSLFDLAYVSFPIPPLAEQESDLKNLVAEIRAFPAVSGQGQVALKNWTRAYKDLSDLKLLLGYARIRDRLRACSSVSLGSYDSAFCSNRQKIESLMGMIFKNMVVADSESEASVNGKLNLKVNEIVSSARSFLDANDTPATRLSRMFNYGNFSLGGAGTLMIGGLSIPSNTAFLNIPGSLGLTSAELARVKVQFGAQGVMITRPNDLVRVAYSRGDSGTVMSYRLDDTTYLPMGVISTIDGVPTSGGLAVHPAEEASGGGESSGGTTTSTNASPGGIISDGNSLPTKPGGGC